MAWFVTALHTRIRNELAQHVRKRDQFAETWLSEKTPMLGRRSSDDDDSSEED